MRNDPWSSNGIRHLGSGRRRDVRFVHNALPAIDTALIVRWDRPEPLLLEVHSHVDPSTVRYIALQATAGLACLQHVDARTRRPHRTAPPLPIDATTLSQKGSDTPPFVTLEPTALLRELTAAHVHAALCTAALHAFAAGNEARLQSMTAAHSQIDRQLVTLQSIQRIGRQDEITEEIIELAAGETASRPGR